MWGFHVERRLVRMGKSHYHFFSRYVTPWFYLRMQTHCYVKKQIPGVPGLCMWWFVNGTIVRDYQQIAMLNNLDADLQAKSQGLDMRPGGVIFVDSEYDDKRGMH